MAGEVIGVAAETGQYRQSFRRLHANCRASLKIAGIISACGQLE